MRGLYCIENNGYLHKINGKDDYSPSFRYGTIEGIKSQYDSGIENPIYITYLKDNELYPDAHHSGSLLFSMCKLN